MKNGEKLALRVWKCVYPHASRGHRLRMVVCDDVSILACVWCGHPMALGSDDVIQALGRRLVATGFRYETVDVAQGGLNESLFEKALNN